MLTVIYAGWQAEAASTHINEEGSMGAEAEMTGERLEGRHATAGEGRR
jgi:hypothetical protein